MNKNKRRSMHISTHFSDFILKLGNNKKNLCSISLASVLMIVMLMGIASAAPYAYISNNWEHTVSVIDTATDTVTTTIPVGSYPLGVAVNPAGTMAYVVNYNGNSVSVIDTNTNTVIATVPVGISPMGVTINPTGTRVYVTNELSNSVSVIDTSSNTVIATVPISGTGLYSIAVNSDGTKVCAVKSNVNGVDVIDAATNTVESTVTVGGTPKGIAVSPVEEVAYVANSASDSISVIDLDTNTVTDTISVGNGPYAVAFNPDGTKVYVANCYDGTVSVIDTATKTVTAAVPVGVLPMGVAVNTDGTKAYVVNSDSDSVSVIDTDTDTVTTTVSVGNTPRCFGQFTVFFTPAPAYTIDKTVTDVAGNGSSAHATKAGDAIKYTITVKNTGNVDLTGVTVSDSLISSLPAPSGDNSPTGTLNVGETWTYTPTYPVSQTELNSKGGGDGDLDNKATVDCNELDAINDTAEVLLDYNPAYSMTKNISDVAG